MNKKFLVFTILIIAASFSAFASIPTLEAVISNVNVFIDGEKAVFRNKEGEEVKPVVIDGTMYLPMRSIVTRMGGKVGWDQYSRSIVIGSPYVLKKTEDDVKRFEQGETWTTDLFEITVNDVTFTEDRGRYDYNEPDYVVYINYTVKSKNYSDFIDYKVDSVVDDKGNNCKEYSDINDAFYNLNFEGTKDFEMAYVVDENTLEVEVVFNILDENYNSYGAVFELPVE